MGVDAGSVYSSIRIRLTDLDNDLKGVYARLNQLEANITKNTTKASSSFKDMFKAVVTGQAVLDLAKRGFSLLTNAVKDSIQVSVAAQEMISKYNVVFDGMGTAAEDAAQRFSEAFDLAGATSKEMLSNTGNLLQGMGATKEESLDMSVAVNTLASDLASFTNNEGGAKTASEAITKALLGEKEQMKSLGIAILDSDVNVRVAKNGQSDLTGTALKLAKAQATLQLVTEQSKNAIGDYARTSDSAANSQKRAAERTKELQIAIGTGLNGVIKGVSNLWSGFADGLTKVINRSSGVGELKIATDDLVKSSMDYKTISDQLATSSDTLNESEKGVLQNRKELLAIDLEKSYISLSKAYDDTNNKVASLNNTEKKRNATVASLLSEQTKLRSMTASQAAEEGKTLEEVALRLEVIRVQIDKSSKTALDSSESAKKMKADYTSAIDSIARAVNDGTISIDKYKYTNEELYNEVMKASESVKAADKAVKDKSETDKKASDIQQTASKKQQEEEQKLAEANEDRAAKDQEQDDARKQAENDYNKAINKTAFDKKSNFIDDQKVAEENLQSTQQYIDKLYELGYANENEIGKKGIESLDSLIEKYPELEEAVKNLSKTEKKATLVMQADWQGIAENGIGSVLSGFSDLGKAMADGTVSMATFGQMGMMAMAAMLQAIGAELAGLAAKALVMSWIFPYPPPVGVGPALIGSAAAYTASGLLTGLAGSFATGGIVPGNSYSGDNMLANVNSGEMILNGGQQKVLFDMISSMANGNGNINASSAPVYLDGKEIAKVVTRYQRNNKV